MKTVVEFTTVSDEYDSDVGMSEKVNRLLSDGWELYGKTVFLLDSRDSLRRCQSMVKYEAPLAINKGICPRCDRGLGLYDQGESHPPLTRWLVSCQPCGFEGCGSSPQEACEAFRFKLEGVKEG